MVHSVIYALRGWLAFVAFIEFSNAIRCFFDEKEFLRGNLFTPDEAKGVTPILARLLGRYCFLNGIIMTHCALCIQHIPIIVLSVCSLTLSVLLYGSEAFYYYTFEVNFYSLFPILISLFTIVSLLIAPHFLDDTPIIKKSPIYDEDDEEDYETMMIKHQARGHKDFQILANKATKKIH